MVSVPLDLSVVPVDVNVTTQENFDKEVGQDLSVVPNNAIVPTEENFKKEVAQDLSDALEDVIVLTEENFNKQVGHDRGALVMFYATWCEHYITLVPEYEKLGTSFKNANSVLIGKVDCNYHKFLCCKYVIRGYPTIQWFPKGSLHPKKYDGRRTVEALVEFVNIEKDALIPIEKNKKMPLKIVDATISDFDQALEKLVSVPNQLNIILFLGDKDPSTSLSWCPDSVRAEPVIYKKLEESSGEIALLRAYVGDRPTWRNPNHPWRVDSRFNLKSIPTLARWENGAVNGRLEDHEAHIESKIDALVSGN